MTVKWSDGTVDKYDGSCTVWHKHPFMSRCSTSTESLLCDLWKYNRKWKGAYPEAHKQQSIDMRRKKINQDIIDFRYELIEKFCSDNYHSRGLANKITKEQKETLKDVLAMYNRHFDIRGYDLG